MSLRCKKRYFYKQFLLFMLKFQSRLYACISRLLTTKTTTTTSTMAKTRKTSYIDKGVSGTRNGMKIFYECVAIIFSSIECSLQYTLRLFLCSFMLAVQSIIIPWTWFRNFYAVECIHLLVKRGLSPVVLNTLVRLAFKQKKTAKSIFIYNFRVKIWIATFFICSATNSRPPRKTQ